jgi:guanylate kinase
VDVQGVENLRGLGVEALYVFVTAPSREELEARLRRRGVDDPASIRQRLAAAGRELAKQDRFDLVVVNDDIERAARELARRVGVRLDA